ncbi:unnamed protein product, partial [Effrenium voratum]
VETLATILASLDKTVEVPEQTLDVDRDEVLEPQEHRRLLMPGGFAMTSRSNETLRQREAMNSRLPGPSSSSRLAAPQAGYTPLFGPKAATCLLSAWLCPIQSVCNSREWSVFHLVPRPSAHLVWLAP